MQGSSGDDVEIVLIAAVAKNGVIGVDGELPWHYSEDLQHFKGVTMNHPVIAGRVTYEGLLEQLGEPLPGRETIVLTTTSVPSHERVHTASTRDEAVEIAAEMDDVVYVIGGASVYEQFLPDADKLIITEIPEAPDGDTTFPSWEETAWEETTRVKGNNVTFVTYERKNNRTY